MERTSGAAWVGGDNTGVVATGANAVSIVQQISQVVLAQTVTSQPSASGLQPPLSNIPPMPRTFVGRAGDVRRVVEALAAETPQVCIIHGLGGVGKSTLAAHIASTYPDTVVRWWITAASFSDIEHGLAALGRELAPTLSVALSDMGTATDEIYCKLAQQWLATRGEWLIVLDNAEDPACIGRILGRLSTGTVIVTSRRASGWHDVGAAVGLETLDSSAATTLLIGIATHGGHRDVTGASELCAALGHLPLAIKQAAAYLAEADVTPTDYVRLLAADTGRMLAARAEGVPERQTIAKTWRITLDQLADTPATGQVLRALAWFAPDSVPRDIITFPELAADFRDALRRLAAYSMVSVADGRVSVHRLVQAVARTPDACDRHRRAEDVYSGYLDALLMIKAGLPRETGPAFWPRWHDLVTHATVALEHRESVMAAVENGSPDWRSAVEITIAMIMDEIAAYALTQHDYTRTIAYYTDALPIIRRDLGAQHDRTVRAIEQLGIAFACLGQADQAIPFLEDALALRIQHFGADHEETLECRRYLGDAYRVEGDLEQAIPHLLQSWSGFEEHHGLDSVQALRTQNSLGIAYREVGSPDLAIDLLESALDRVRESHGPRDQITLHTLLNLADALETTGYRRESIPFYEEAVAGFATVMTVNHPQTLLAMHNLAVAVFGTEDVDRASELFEEVLAAEESVLGPDHPDTIISRRHLEQCRLLKKG